MKNKNILFISSALVLIALFFVATKSFQSSKQKELDFLALENSELFVRDYSPRYGSPDAKVYLVEFLDPECESCRFFYPKVKDLLEEFEGKIQLVVRYAPFHKNSKKAVRALEATREQGLYWESLEILFHYQPAWASHHHPRPELVFEYLPKVGVNVEQLKKDMLDSKIDRIIEQDMKDLESLQVRKTPTFFVNGKQLNRFSIENLRELIKEQIEKNY